MYFAVQQDHQLCIWNFSVSQKATSNSTAFLLRMGAWTLHSSIFGSCYYYSVYSLALIKALFVSNVNHICKLGKTVSFNIRKFNRLVTEKKKKSVKQPSLMLKWYFKRWFTDTRRHTYYFIFNSFNSLLQPELVSWYDMLGQAHINISPKAVSWTYHHLIFRGIISLLSSSQNLYWRFNSFFNYSLVNNLGKTEFLGNLQTQTDFSRYSSGKVTGTCFCAITVLKRCLMSVCRL